MGDNQRFDCVPFKGVIVSTAKKSRLKASEPPILAKFDYMAVQAAIRQNESRPIGNDGATIFAAMRELTSRWMKTAKKLGSSGLDC